MNQFNYFSTQIYANVPVKMTKIYLMKATILSLVKVFVEGHLLVHVLAIRIWAVG